VNGQKYSADHIMIATGGRPTIPNIPGAQEHGITSDGFFDLEKLPSKTVVVGAGYIAVELAGILGTLGSDTSILIRYDEVLRTFDPVISGAVTHALENESGVKVCRKTQVTNVTKEESGLLTVETTTGTIDDVECLLFAIGRKPNIEIGIDGLGMELDRGHIKVDAFQNTNVPNIYALGDVCGKALLTPGIHTIYSVNRSAY